MGGIDGRISLLQFKKILNNCGLWTVDYRLKPMSKKKKEGGKKKARVHKELEGFEIKVNPLGEITSNYNIDQLNEFLNRNVRDKKLVKKDEPDPEEEELYRIESSAEEEEPEDAFLSAPLSADEDVPVPKKKRRSAADDDPDTDIDETKV